MMGGGQGGPTGAQMAGVPAPDYQGVFGNLQKNPLDWSQFGHLGNGQDAADQAYGFSTSRLDPQWQRREDAQRTQLLNQGLDPGSEAYHNAMTDLGQQRNDAYAQARANSLHEGQGIFDQNLRSRQQMIAEALKARGLPLQELQQLDQLFSGYQDKGEQAQAEGIKAGGDLAGALAQLFMGMPPTGGVGGGGNYGV